MAQAASAGARRMQDGQRILDMTLSSPVDADQLRESLLRFIEERVRLELLTAHNEASTSHSPRLEISHRAPQWSGGAREAQQHTHGSVARRGGEFMSGTQLSMDPEAGGAGVEASLGRLSPIEASASLPPASALAEQDATGALLRGSSGIRIRAPAHAHAC